ncbi:MAG: CDP-glucose 4,6-dehydratase [Rubrivivax sp.]|nr:CDP-glucose 4,6-dehydratase [Rubrivivax sp.]
MNPDPAFWRGKRVFVTGHTGFKGSWLALWLNRLGASVSGYALPAATPPSLHALLPAGVAPRDGLGDVRDEAALAAAVRRARPEIVLHLAAQPLVRASYRRPVETFATNVMGTAHLLEAVRGVEGVRAVVIVTTDKVYRNLEWAYPYREDDALGGHDPYSASKAASELVAASYRDAFLADTGVAVATARAGNVIGGGDWSEDRLIPDAVRAWQAQQPLTIRRPRAVRPWQHVLEPLAGYLRLAERLCAQPSLAGAYNFGPLTGEAATVGEVIELAAQAYGRGQWHCPDDTAGPHEAGWLALEVARARTALAVEPRWGLKESVRRSLHWYRRYGEGASVMALCESDIADFEASAARPTAAPAQQPAQVRAIIERPAEPALQP